MSVNFVRQIPQGGLSIGLTGERCRESKRGRGIGPFRDERHDGWVLEVLCDHTPGFIRSARSLASFL